MPIFNTISKLPNNLCEFITRRHISKGLFRTETPVLNAGFKDF